MTFLTDKSTWAGTSRVVKYNYFKHEILCLLENWLRVFYISF